MIRFTQIFDMQPGGLVKFDFSQKDIDKMLAFSKVWLLDVWFWYHCFCYRQGDLQWQNISCTKVLGNGMVLSDNKPESMMINTY